MYVNNVTAEKRNLSPRLIYSPNLISYKNTSKCRLWISYQEQSIKIPQSASYGFHIKSKV